MSLGRLKAPKENAALLAEPTLLSWPQLLAQNQDWLSRYADRVVLGAPLGAWRHLARSEMLSVGRGFLDLFQTTVPRTDLESQWILTGHQPETFHAGVWVKNFGIARLAEKVGGLGINVLADHDLVKSAAVRVPAGSPKYPLEGMVSLDRLAGEIPYELWDVADEEMFTSFGDKVAESIAAFSSKPVLTPFWKATQNAKSVTKNVGLRMAHGRRSVEERWGTRNLELPLSRLCTGRAFSRFVAAAILNAAPFAAVHNRELLKFRKMHRIRSHNHPFPMLAVSEFRIESPFWIWSPDKPRRLPLIVERSDLGIRLLAGNEVAWEAPDDSSFESLAEQLISTLRPWRIRPRALTTTLFLRLFVADLFVHGIGGGKYDELTDAIISSFFEIDPPRYSVLTATTLIVPDLKFEAEKNLRTANHRRRDLEWNPDRYLEGTLAEQSPIADWIEKKFELMSEAPRPHDRNRFAQFRQLNDRLREFVALQTKECDQAVKRAKLLAVNERALANREYPFFVHDISNIDRLVDSLDRALS